MNLLEVNIQEKRLLQLLQEVGYDYLSSGEVIEMQEHGLSQVLLEPVLREQIKRINGNVVSETAVDEAIEALCNPSWQDGYLSANQYVYDLLRRGVITGQQEEPGSLGYSIQYIDWEYPSNNRFHVTDGYGLSRSGQPSGICPDIVLFLNGIPVGIIECKVSRSGDKRGAIEQHLRNQLPDGMRELYLFSHLLFSVTNDESRYGTNGSPAEHWYRWKELYPDVSQRKLQELLDRKPTEAEELLYNMARPERLVDLLYRFVIYTNGVKRVARSHQFFAVRQTMERIHEKNDGVRRGGVIWHTSGSGKTLTMVMLAQAIQLDKGIENPKIILVTDRLDADLQLTDTFRNCGTYIENATTGKMLAALLENKSSVVLSTVVQKFGPAMKQISSILDSPDIFVLVDEAHRIQDSLFASPVQEVLPHACFIGFTGMPFTEEYEEKVKLFGEKILPVYTLKRAVDDGVVVPLRYESHQLSTFFGAEERIKDVANHISDDFRSKSENRKGSFKGLLICNDRVTALRYKKYFEEIGTVSAEVFVNFHTNDSEETKEFRDRIMATYGSFRKYQENLLYRFKNSPHPELLIGVDMLLTEFDNPKNTVLYIDRLMDGHSLLQMIARINRIYPGKDFGYIVDYNGLFNSLSQALDMEAEAETESVDEDNGNEDLNQLVDLEHSDSEIYYPVVLAGNPFECAFYQVLRENLEKYNSVERNIELVCCTIAHVANGIIENSIYIEGKMIVDWPARIDIRRTLSIEFTDYLVDHIKKDFDLPLSWDEIDNLLEALLKVSVNIYGVDKKE